MNFSGLILPPLRSDLIRKKIGDEIDKHSSTKKRSVFIKPRI